MFMSLCNRLILAVIISALGMLAGCGGNSNNVTNPTPPPSGGFSNSNLNGTYVFSASGTDQMNGTPYAIVGTLTANGSGGITSGAIDMIDAAFTAPVTNVSVGGTYKVGVDGRTQTTLIGSTPFGQNLVLDFVLQDSSHGLVIEFDGNATGSGSLDLQTSGATPTGSYAFLLSGGYISNGSIVPFVSVGNFALGSNGTFSGLEDFNNNGFAYTNQTLTGALMLGPSSSPATTMTTMQFGTQTFDVFAVDANHLKFIETDGTATLSGDAFSQSNSPLPASTFAFTLQGSYPAPNNISAAGGFLSIDGAGNVTNTSTIDVNNGGTVSQSPLAFSGTYTAAGTGRFTSTLTGFEGTQYAIYPFSGGLLLLEIDNPGGIMAGVAYPQSSGATFTTSDGYGLNLSGGNLAQSTFLEVDDIAEFTGSAITGVIDENFAPGGGPAYGMALGTGSVSGPDSSGRWTLTANAGTSSQSTLNGGFQLTFYAVDGTTFPFIETDANNQIASGVFLKQNASAASSAAMKSHAFIMQPIPHPHALARKAR
jgi:hypothetical protein